MFRTRQQASCNAGRGAMAIPSRARGSRHRAAARPGRGWFRQQRPRIVALYALRPAGFATATALAFRRAGALVFAFILARAAASRAFRCRAFKASRMADNAALATAGCWPSESPSSAAKKACATFFVPRGARARVSSLVAMLSGSFPIGFSCNAANPDQHARLRHHRDNGNITSFATAPRNMPGCGRVSRGDRLASPGQPVRRRAEQEVDVLGCHRRQHRAVLAEGDVRQCRLALL